MSKAGLAIMLTFVLAALFAPVIAPNDPSERVVVDGEWVKGGDPSLDYPLGTTSDAYPLFSRLVYGTRIAFKVGITSAAIVVFIGTIAGLLAGYKGGLIETVIMRLVDTAYGLPFLPFAIVLIMLFGKGTNQIIIAISLILWRNTARVIRAEVVSIKEQPMIDAAVASGASDARILIHHIAPKIVPISLLYSVFAIGWSIIAEAGLSFIGFGTAEDISWGFILNNAYASNAIYLDLWLWLISPGALIVLFVLSVYFIAQGLEEVANPKLRGVEK